MLCFCIQRRSLFLQGFSAPAGCLPKSPQSSVASSCHMPTPLPCVSSRYLAILSVQDMVMSCSPSRTPSHVCAALWHRTGMVPSPDSIFVRRCPRYFLTMCLLLFTGQINTRMAIIEYFSKEPEKLCWCHSLHLQNHLWRSFKLDAKLDEITAQESSTVQKRRCSYYGFLFTSIKAYTMHTLSPSSPSISLIYLKRREVFCLFKNQYNFSF